MAGGFFLLLALSSLKMMIAAGVSSNKSDDGDNDAERKRERERSEIYAASDGYSLSYFFVS